MKKRAKSSVLAEILSLLALARRYTLLSNFRRQVLPNVAL